MRAQILAIGDELLTGQTLDTNSNYISKRLNEIGIQVMQISCITDKKGHIIETLDRALESCDLVIFTGGLGPTKDDITKNVLAEYFNDELIVYPEILKGIEDYFDSINVPVLKVNRDQALLPQNARILKNDLGTASGMWFEKKGNHVISLPGVPYEMKGLMDKLIPQLKAVFQLAGYYHKTVQFQGMGESRLAEMLEDLENQCESENIGVAYLPSPGIVKIRFTGKNEQSSRINEIVKGLLTDYPKLAFGMENEALELVVGRILQEKNKTLGTVESCTGGGLSKRITSVPGSSAYYMGSIVSYDNRIKTDLVGVDGYTLSSVGAVSKEVVESMASNGLQKLGVDYCVATSGIAGPDGGSEEKPVGTVWIAVAGPDGIVSKKFTFKHNRERNIELSIVYGLNFLRRALLNLLD